MTFIGKNIALILLIGLFSLTFWRCTPDEEIVDYNYTGGLEFSTDSVVFDTVFTGMGSVTKRFIVRNTAAKALKIQGITLSGGDDSPFKIFINGRETSGLTDVRILGKDSALVLVEVFIDPGNANSPYLVQDSVEFETNGIIQNVQLLAWGQDANYLGNEVIECDAVWSNDKPYVLYQSVLVDTLCGLTIEKGTRIYAGKDAYLYVKGQLLVRGTPEERVQFRNVRLDATYENIPGQWGGIVFLEGTYDNRINFASIRNAIYGIRLGAPDSDTIPELVIENTIIENMSHSGILAFTSDLLAENTLINNCVQFVCANIAGGNYTYRHCTMANYPNSFIPENPAVYFSDNLLLDDKSTIVDDLQVTLYNTIIYGEEMDEIVFNLDGGAITTLGMRNNIFRTTLDILDTLGNQLNTDPNFVDVLRYNFRLDTLSPAKNNGVAIGVLTDLDGNLRDLLPDIGAYERIE
jgi:hypothetical protein